MEASVANTVLGLGDGTNQCPQSKNLKILLPHMKPCSVSQHMCILDKFIFSVGFCHFTPLGKM